MRKLFRFLLLLFVCGLSVRAGAQLVANFTASPLSGCAPLVVQFTNTSTGNPSSFKWDFGNGVTSVITNPSTTYLTSGTYAVKLVVSNSSGKDSIIKTNYITVYPVPTVKFGALPPGGCPPFTTQFQDSSLLNVPGTGTYQWSFGDGTPFSNTQNPTHTYPNPGDYPITLTVTNSQGCVKSLTKPSYINVYKPIADFTANPQNYCNVPDSVTFTPSVIGSGPFTYAWDFGDGGSGTGGNPTHVYTTPGTYTVSVITTDAHGCKDTTVKSNYVNAGVLVANFTTSPSTACVNTSFQFTNASVGGTSVLWDFGDGSNTNFTNPVHTYTAAGVYNVTLKIMDGTCWDTVTIPITVNPKPSAAFTFAPLQPCPANSSVQFTNNSTGATTYLWDFGDGFTSTLTSPTHIYTSNSVFNVQLTAITQYGCTDVASKLDTVHDMYFDWPNPYGGGCGPVTLFFHAELWTTTPKPPPAYHLPHRYPYAITSYFWDFGDGTTSTQDTVTHTYTATGTYIVTLTVTTANGCTWSEVNSVHVVDRPIASFTGFPDTLCVKELRTLINTSTNIDYAGTKFYWDLDYPSGLQGGYSLLMTGNQQQVGWSTKGSHSVQLVADSYGCRDTFTAIDAFWVNPPGGFTTISYDCDSPLKVRLSGTALDATSMMWDFGDGTTSTDTIVTHTYPALGNYTAIFIAENSNYNCVDSVRNGLRLIDPVLTFSTPDTAICLEDSIIFTPNYTDIPGIYEWFIDHQYPYWPFVMQPNPLWYWQSFNTWGYLFRQKGIFTVTVTTNDIHGCRDTATRSNYILVAKPLADFTGTPAIGCTPIDVFFQETSLNTPGAYSVSREWDFGNGLDTVVTDTVTRTYGTSGLFSVNLVVTDNVGCKDTVYKQNYIETRVAKASFTANKMDGCLGESLSFINNSTGVNLTYLWDFGDGTTATSATPVKAYLQTGVYTVKLIVSDVTGCSDTLIRNNFIRITKPTASFSMSDTLAICPPLNTIFLNTSTGAISYLWDMGNGATSTSMNPTANYPTPGKYTITMIATDLAGCKDTATGNATVLGFAGGLSYTPVTGCVPLTVKFTAYLTDVPSIMWDFSDGVTTPLGAADTIAHTYQTPGAYVPKLILSDNAGCQNSSIGIDTIKVDAVLGDFVTTPACVNMPVTFTDTSFSFFSPIDHQTWTFNNGNTTTFEKPVLTYNAAGSYPVSLVTVNKQGCKDSISRMITIYNLPPIDAGPDTTVCSGDAATLMASGGVAYEWSPTQWVSCTDCATTLATPPAGSAFIVKGTDEHGCVNKDTVLVHLQYKTTSTVDSGGSICIDSVFQLHAHGAHRYEWSPAGDLSAYNVPDPVAAPQTTTVYTVTAWEGSCPPDSHKVKVVVFPKPVVNAGSDATIVAGTTIMLQAIGSGIAEFLWSPAATLSCTACSNPIASPVRTTQYIVTASTDKGCRSFDTVVVHVLCDKSQLFIPNTFTPNHDGYNDVFYPRGEGLRIIRSFKVYNRWGELLFERTNIQLNDAGNGWDGTYKGQLLNPDVFVYVIEATCEGGETLRWKGDINLIR